jgi:hypothetical protein
MAGGCLHADLSVLTDSSMSDSVTRHEGRGAEVCHNA